MIGRGGWFGYVDFISYVLTSIEEIDDLA